MIITVTDSYKDIGEFGEKRYTPNMNVKNSVVKAIRSIRTRRTLSYGRAATCAVRAAKSKIMAASKNSSEKYKKYKK